MTRHMLAVVESRIRGHVMAACKGCPDSLHVKIARMRRIAAYLNKRTNERRARMFREAI